MSVWSEFRGQPEATAEFRAAVEDRRPGALTHSWAIVGPPGSGRSTIAEAFAAALASGDPEGDPRVLAQISAGTHPDVHNMRTDVVSIRRQELREAVARAGYEPVTAKYRVFIVQDADRMTESTANVLLKEIEESAEHTVWLLCAPSSYDLIPTIRSRVRVVRLRAPALADVAELVARRTGTPVAEAERAAREAQCHIGMALRLAASEEARARRAETLDIALQTTSIGRVVRGAARLLEIAAEDARSLNNSRESSERESMLRTYGTDDESELAPRQRADLKADADEQRRRTTRGLRDGYDRILTDLSSLYRDVLLLQLGTDVTLVNEAIEPQVREFARAGTVSLSLRLLDGVTTARTRLQSNVQPALVFEALLATGILAGSST